MPISRFFRPAALAAGLLAPLVTGLAPVALAQSGPGYFIPPSARPAQAPAPRQSAPRQAPRQAPAAVQPMEPPPGPPGAIAGPGADEGPAMQLQLPPAPDLPALPKAPGPPAAVIGVLGIPEIMRASTGAQQVEKVIGQRREKLNEDAQKEQVVWREMQQALANERSKLSAEQIRAREKDLQDRITTAQRTFRDRNRIIQQAGQYGLAQIERILVGVIRQVAESHGMNLVLHRAQVALNVNEFDITDQVTAQLNKVLPTVSLPADGVAPPMAALPPQNPAGATPASANAGGAPPAVSAPAPPQSSPPQSSPPQSGAGRPAKP